MDIQWFGSGTDVDTIPGFLTGVYVEELRRLGHEVEAHQREDAARAGVRLRADRVVVQDVDPRQPFFGDWLLREREQHKCRAVLLTQSDWWQDERLGVNYAQYVEDLYYKGAVDYVLCYSRDGAEKYQEHGLRAEFMCAVAAPSWWTPMPRSDAVVDVVYVGSRYNNREAIQEAYVNALRGAGLSVEVYGERQEHGFVPFSRMRETLGRGRIVLALTTPLTAPYYGACTGRVFTGPMAGRVTISNAWRGIDDFFGVYMACVDTPEAAVGEARKLLTNWDYYDRCLASQAYLVRRENTYRHRAEKVLQVLEEDYGAHS